jgi:hypothetical protein
MITPRLAVALQQHGYDVVSCQAAGRHNRGISDADQLAYATADNRTIYTFNATDFDQLDRDWHNDGGWHSGIVASEDLNQRFPEMFDRLKRYQLNPAG